MFVASKRLGHIRLSDRWIKDIAERSGRRRIGFVLREAFRATETDCAVGSAVLQEVDFDER